jgi:hypothetical protein
MAQSYPKTQQDEPHLLNALVNQIAAKFRDLRLGGLERVAKHGAKNAASLFKSAAVVGCVGMVG